ncbi:MAG: DUF3142 domain-containing protein [Planctomycetes bacterium]|nr:DUF3142 domain-containing protein [Planctomycetota bacterium]
MGCKTVFAYQGVIESAAGRFALSPGGGQLNLPDGVALHAVFRLAASATAALTPEKTAAARALILDAFQKCRRKHPLLAGLQLDCDMPTSRLGEYAEFLRELRTGLPPECELSATMLLDWLRSADLPALMSAVDFVAPQFYSTEPPKGPDADSLVFGGDLKAAILRLEAIGRPYLVGLPVFEQCSLFDAAGRLEMPALPVSAEGALAAGAQFRRQSLGAENTVELAFPEPATVGNLRIPAGARLLIGMPTAVALCAQVLTLRDLTPKHCRAVCFYRLPGGESTHTLSLAQVNAALSGTVAPARLAATLSRHDGAWRLRIRNGGAEDWLNFAAPARVTLQAANGHAAVEPLLSAGRPYRCYPTRGGNPCSPLRADGIAVEIGLVRAGQEIALEPIRLECRNDSRTISGKLSWGVHSADLEVVNAAD